MGDPINCRDPSGDDGEANRPTANDERSYNGSWGPTTDRNGNSQIQKTNCQNCQPNPVTVSFGGDDEKTTSQTSDTYALKDVLGNEWDYVGRPPKRQCHCPVWRNPLVDFFDWLFAAPNGGNGPKHGGTNHNDVIDDRVRDLQNTPGVENVRKNQRQVDINGNTVGNNQPEIQHDRDRVHHMEEYDTIDANGVKHEEVIRGNDPIAEVELHPVE
jgi:hypothetical protein